MRKLKFRAWNKTTHQYRHFVLEKGVRVNISADFEIEQYIGLNDKNGKEIYEGDIVKIVKAKRFNENMELVNCRRKNEGNYVVLYDELNGEYVFCESNETDSAGISGFPYWAEYCVIGNIHENPKLLGEKKCEN